jgi:uncharacterized protein (UPF0335 family)
MSDHNTSAARFVERLVTLMEERGRVGEDVRDLMLEAKSAGHMPAAIRKVAAESYRAKYETNGQAAKRQAVEEEMDRIKHALGMISDLPLGEAAMARAE